MTRTYEKLGIWDKVEEPITDIDFEKVTPFIVTGSATGLFSKVLLEWEADFQAI